MEIRMLSCIAGAKQATGTAIIIDVYRAFTCQLSPSRRGHQKSSSPPTATKRSAGKPKASVT